MPVCGWIGTIKEDSGVTHEATMMNICSKDGSTELFPRTTDSFDQIGYCELARLPNSFFSIMEQGIAHS